jgi:small ligand-binding sensory domain FIST
MKWCSVLSQQPDFGEALDEVEAELCAQLDGAHPDLLVLFVSPHHLPYAALAPDRLIDRFGPRVTIGSSAGGVIGASREIEGAPALSVTAAVLPDVALRPFRVAPNELARFVAAPDEWVRELGCETIHEPGFLLLADPFSCDADEFIGSLDLAFPGSPKVGGLASGGVSAGQNRLFLDDAVHARGAIGVAMWGDLVMDTAVAQGCRPVGEPLVITRCQRNLIYELNGRGAVRELEATLASVSSRELELFRKSPHLGICIDKSITRPHLGDFLVRNLIGLDSAAGVIGVGALIEEQQVVQFHVRDAQTSAEDLHEVLSRYRREVQGPEPEGALLFSCLGRGVNLYGVPDHDTEVFRRAVAKVPVGGFFCNGEIGPIHAKTFLHGYSSAFGIFRPRGWN